MVLAAVYVSQLAHAVLLENQKMAQFLAKQIFHRAFEVVPGTPDPYAALREDPGIRSLLESTIFGPVLTGASIVDTNGIVVASDDRSLIGQRFVPHDELTKLVNGNV